MKYDLAWSKSELHHDFYEKYATMAPGKKCIKIYMFKRDDIANTKQKKFSGVRAQFGAKRNGKRRTESATVESP